MINKQTVDAVTGAVVLVGSGIAIAWAWCSDCIDELNQEHARELEVAAARHRAQLSATATAAYVVGRQDERSHLIEQARASYREPPEDPPQLLLAKR